jgi:hypothetical protein
MVTLFNKCRKEEGMCSTEKNLLRKVNRNQRSHKKCRVSSKYLRNFERHKYLRFRSRNDKQLIRIYKPLNKLLILILLIYVYDRESNYARK